jgi:hypothetical protein
MEAAFAARAAFASCPCCVGKLKFSLSGGTSFSAAPLPASQRAVPAVEHPRSRWLRESLPDPRAAFACIARAADIAHAEESSAASAASAAAAAGGARGNYQGDDAAGAGAAGAGGGRAAEGPGQVRSESLARLCKLHVELDRRRAPARRAQRALRLSETCRPLGDQGAVISAYQGAVSIAR